jgi:hypothetical protein
MDLQALQPLLIAMAVAKIPGEQSAAVLRDMIRNCNASCYDKALSGLEGVDVHEDLLVAEVRLQAVIEATRIRDAVFPAVADKNACHGFEA